MFEKGGLEVMDPIRYDFVAEWAPELREKRWCQACLDRKQRAWEEKRAKWRKRMNELLFQYIRKTPKCYSAIFTHNSDD